MTVYDDVSVPDNGIYVHIPFEKYKKITEYKVKASQVYTYEETHKDMCMVHTTYSRIKNKCYEQMYLDSMMKILRTPSRESRNGRTHSSFGLQFKYDCSDGKVPLLTTKKMAWKTCIKELLWFISGNTDNQTLVRQNVHIWDGNASREFLDSRGLYTRNTGDLGPVYGFQWRHWGEKYVSSQTKYNGVDQLVQCEKMIMTEPHSRRIIMTTWNPSQLSEMALPPCHILVQWFVDSENKLWLQFYQRSGDMFLGIPFNMFSYSVLLHIMAQRTKLKPGGVVHVIGDAHVYSNHIDAIHTQIQNDIHAQPTLVINHKNEWEEYTINDFQLKDYTCAEKIYAPMSA